MAGEQSLLGKALKSQLMGLLMSASVLVGIPFAGFYAKGLLDEIKENSRVNRELLSQVKVMNYRMDSLEDKVDDSGRRIERVESLFFTRLPAPGNNK